MHSQYPIFGYWQQPQAVLADAASRVRFAKRTETGRHGLAAFAVRRCVRTCCGFACVPCAACAAACIKVAAPAVTRAWSEAAGAAVGI